ncbi:MAG TPA: CHAD domain-containing protein [Dongiaceae bacterium]|jgi:inorganic triphosphatase YgiF
MSSFTPEPLLQQGPAPARESRPANASVAEEVEIKLRLPPGLAARLKRSAVLRSLARGRGRTRHLLSVYFDTPRFELRSAGAALRIRHIGQRRIQTIKLPIGGPTGLQTLREIECDVRSDGPDLTQVSDEEIKTWLQSPAIAGALAPVFTTEFKRTVWPIVLHESEIEMALDLGEVRAGERRVPIGEVELELKSGKPARLVELALLLHHEIPVAWEHETKAARGYRLAVDQVPQPERARAIAINPAMSARLAFVAIAQACLRHIRANEGCARLGQDPEGVHQFRVGVRRLRALVGAYRKEIVVEFTNYLARELDWLQTQCGAARDWDVFISDSLERLHARLPGDPAVSAMLRAASALRDESYVGLRATLDEPRYTELLLRLELALIDGSWSTQTDVGSASLDRPVAEFATSVLGKRYKKLRAIGGKRADLPEQDLHRLRIAGKKLRYTAEFFRGLYTKKAASKFIAALADVQDHLGSLNDALVSQQLLLSLEGRIANGNDIEAARHASGMILGWQAARTDHDLAKLASIWRKLRDRSPFWTKDLP